MGEFRTWLESMETDNVQTLDEAQALSRSTGLDTRGLEFNLIADALEAGTPVSYQGNFPLSALNIPAGDKNNVLQMMGAFAQKMGLDAPDTLEQASALKIRGPDFRKMTPPIIIRGGQIEDGVSRANAAKLLRVNNIRAFVIG